MLRTLPLRLLLLLVTGCGMGREPSFESQPDAHAHAIVEGTAPAAGVLAMLNHPATTVAALDEDAALDVRAARNLIAHRDGGDAQPGTGDDRSFDTIAEVDAIEYVGPSALAKLEAFAAAGSWIPEGTDVLGTWDEVTFSVVQAEETVALANGASVEMLDVEVALDRRAVDAIVAARPLDTVLALSELYYVGPSALLKMRDWTDTADPGAAGSDCSATTDCDAGLVCRGIPFDGAPAIGKCVSDEPIAGDGEECSAADPCGSGLVCAGTTIYGGAGFCRPSWMEGVFTSRLEMPIAEGAATASEVVVYGLASVPEDVVLTLEIDHPRPEDLVVTVRAPNSSEDVVWNHVADPQATLPVGWGVERDSHVNGTWTCEVRDTVTGETGFLRGFSLRVNSRWD